MFKWPDTFATVAEFNHARTELLARYRVCLGEMPERVELRPKLLATKPCPGYRRELVEYTVEQDEPPVRAFVCIPDQIRPGAPAVVCLHQHAGQFNLGKSEQVGRLGSPHQRQALELAARGFITMAADSRCFEERGKYWDGDGIYNCSLIIRGATLAGRFVWDIQREVDYLLTRPEVNPERIGVIGHSMGAQQILITLPLEPRFRAAVAGEGLKLYSGMLTRGDTFSQPQIVPGFYRYADLDALPAMYAPSPLMITGRTKDHVSPLEDQVAAEARLRAIYALHGASDKIDFPRDAGDHQFSPPLREAAYAWLEKHLAE